MAITRFEEAKNKRYFYVSSFRKLGQIIVLSMALNVVIIMAMAYIFFHQPSPKYYSTNGISYPIQLKSMGHPNHSSVAMLSDEQS